MREKKTIIILILVLTIGVVCLTIAYFANSSTITNTFNTNPYGTTVTEEFISPDNWLPGTITPKTLVVTNSGSVDEAVRVSYTESWTSANSNSEGDLALSQNNNRAALIKWTNPSDWTEVTEGGTTYRYYNYKLAPNEVTTSLLESVTFNPLITNSSNCTTTESNGTKTITCNSTGNGYDGATYKLVFTIETVQYNKYVEAWNTNVAILEEKPAPVVELTGAEYLASSATNAVDAEYNDSTKGNMFTFSHTVNGKIVNESRYIGDAPNNYVYFNCDEPQEGVEYNYANSCEVWRILGTFDVERTDPTDSTKTITETRMKLVRGYGFATIMQWDNRDAEGYDEGNGYGKNDWNGSVMNTYLNGTYYQSLSQTAQSQIGDAIYYLGGFPFSSSDTTYTAEKIYEMERGNTVYSGRPTSWEGEVALMYPSDMYMTYAKTDGVGCYNQPMNGGVCGATNGAKSWIYNTNKLEGQTEYQWTRFLSPCSSTSDSVFAADSTFLNKRGSRNFGVARPVVYLKSSVQIIDGDGSSNNPYKLQ